MNVKPTENGKSYSDKGFRKYTCPDGCDVETLARETAAWLEAEHAKETECMNVQNGWLVKAKDTGGKLSRLMKRKAESMHVFMAYRDGFLNVRAANEEWTVPLGKTEEKKSMFKDAAPFAMEVTANLADAAASEVSDVWLESGTTEAVYEFVSRRIAESFQTASGEQVVSIDPCLSRYVESMSDIQSAWAAAFAGPGEVLVAWLGTSTTVDGTKSEWTFIITTHKVALSAFSKDGPEKEMRLEGETMSMTDSVGRNTVTIGDKSFRTQLQNDSLFQQIASLLALDPMERLRESARLNFIHGQESVECMEYVRASLDHVLKTSTDPLDDLGRFYINMDFEQVKRSLDPFETAVASKEFAEIADKLSDGSDAEKLKTWSEAWRLNTAEKISLAGRIQDLIPNSKPRAELTGLLLEDSRRELLEKSKDKSYHLIVDIRYAENLILRDCHKDAEKILENRMVSLPDETLYDLLPQENSDLTQGQGGQLIKISMLELLARARGVADNPDEEALRQLAVLQPLIPERLKAYRDSAKGKNLYRISAVLRLLEKDGLFPEPGDDAPIPTGGAVALDSKTIEEKLRHTASREGSVLRKVQNFIATKKTPDHTVLKSYAKRADIDGHPNIFSAIVDGNLMLGLKSVEVYISFGELNRGIRAYEGSPPFVLIGCEHLETESPFFLMPAEIRFLIGEELAHIRYGHERITSHEVWTGVIDKSVLVLEMLPFVGKYLSKIGKLGKLAGYASDIAKRVGYIQQYISQARTFATSASNLYERHTKKDQSATISEDEQNLIGAFRVMQLTADRTALVLCGNPKAAVRAIFKSSPKLQVELPVAEKYGLRTFLGRQDEDGNLMYQDLAIRLAALFSFYISEEYETLRAAAMPSWVIGDGDKQSPS